MNRQLMLGIALLVLTATSHADAQQWANKMFKVHQHNFGAVARGSKQVFEFEFENPFVEDVHIASVKSSCGCTSPTVTKRTLKTWEKAAVVATYNTSSFLGAKSATVTVTIDKPYYAEVQLRVSGFIRGDVVFEPGSVNFGEVNAGEKKEKTVRVTYAGRSNWSIKDVRSSNPNFEVQLAELQRTSGRVAYEMKVRMKESTPSGFFADQLTLVTDDRENARIPLPVEGKVIPAVTVYPELLSFTSAPGESERKQLVVRGRKPFKITKVDCGDDCFDFELSDESKKVHVIPVVFARDKAGKLDEKVIIKTDFAGGSELVCRVTATVE